jgi:hypothetical protein
MRVSSALLPMSSFALDAFDVGVDGGFADAHPGGGLGVGEATGARAQGGHDLGAVGVGVMNPPHS